ncbi:hypothetical protein DB30_04135 [Enhygromyxa salina]|uniref:Uncharacterized protein n=1 Tax=Enhygromyxa salina TaxID=215803 RepID=A0A0C2D0N5_9BACT|nr:hypothetical protein DB30_04135 [Enhygromyxa salina]
MLGMVAVQNPQRLLDPAPASPGTRTNLAGIAASPRLD